MEENAIQACLDEMHRRARLGRRLYFTPQSACLQPLAAQFELAKHRTLVLWAFEFAEKAVKILSGRYRGETRFRLALNICKDWAAGGSSLREARGAILRVHAFAKETDNRDHIALSHALGQGLSVVHTRKHALGFPLYDLTAIVHRHGIDACARALEHRLWQYADRLTWWRDHTDDHPGPWAEFLLRD